RGGPVLRASEGKADGPADLEHRERGVASRPAIDTLFANLEQFGDLPGGQVFGRRSRRRLGLWASAHDAADLSLVNENVIPCCNVKMSSPWGYRLPAFLGLDRRHAARRHGCEGAGRHCARVEFRARA